ncbi:AI-2E family transporter [Actinomadura sediminis]|uniref:AI-2E family transporter n=1 Tax=Actinomadura sediminis TaxID=1038904 RepID=A0ABW3EL96_9ACTN
MPDETPREDGSAAPPGPAHVPAPTPPPDDAPAGGPEPEPTTGDGAGSANAEPTTDAAASEGAAPATAATAEPAAERDEPSSSDTSKAASAPGTPGRPDTPTGTTAEPGASGEPDTGDTEASTRDEPGAATAEASGAEASDDRDERGTGHAGTGSEGERAETRPQDTDVLDDSSAGGGEPAAKPAKPVPAGGAVVAEPGAPLQVTPDPAMDVEQRRREAGVDQRFPFGRPGQPLGRHHPFVFGFTAALGVITAWLLVQAATSARSTIVMIVVALFLAIGLNPAVERLRRIGLPRGLAVGAVFFGVLLFFAGFVASLVQPVTEQVNELRESIPHFVEQLQNNKQLVEWDKRYGLLERAEKFVNGEDFQKQVTDAATGIGRVAISGVLQTVTILILTLYFLGSLPQIKTFFYKLAPRTRRARVALLGDEILDRIGGYVAGQFIIGFIAGALSYVFLSILGVKYALALSLIVAVTALIPLVGATIGAVVVCLIAFLTGSLTDVIACVIFYVAYQQIENYLIYPRVMKRTVDVQPAVTIVAALVGAALLGVVGALLAIPTAAAVSLLIREVVLPRQETL